METNDLRKYRTMTAKKRILEKHMSETAAETASPAAGADEPAEKKPKVEAKTPENKETKKDATKSESDPENNAMTLEQFTDIVLASEGLVVKKEPKSPKMEPASKLVVLEPNAGNTGMVNVPERKPVLIETRDERDAKAFAERFNRLRANIEDHFISKSSRYA